MTTIPNPGVTMQVPIHEISPNPRQPRKVFKEDALAELAESIRQNGLLQPITVRPVGDEFEIIAGERRWRAHQVAGLEVIDVIVREVDDATAFELAIIENVNREDMNPVEEAQAYAALMTDGRTKEQVADLLGKSRVHVEYRLALLRLDDPIRDMVAKGQIGIALGWQMARLTVNGQYDVIRRMTAGTLATEAEAAKYVSVVVLRESEIPLFDLGDPETERRQGEARKALAREMHRAGAAVTALDRMQDLSIEDLALLPLGELAGLLERLEMIGKAARRVRTHAARAQRLAEAAA